jgi:hypothetical protein
MTRSSLMTKARWAPRISLRVFVLCVLALGALAGFAGRLAYGPRFSMLHRELATAEGRRYRCFVTWHVQPGIGKSIVYIALFVEPGEHQWEAAQNPMTEVRGHGLELLSSGMYLNGVKINREPTDVVVFTTKKEVDYVTLSREQIDQLGAAEISEFRNFPFWQSIVEGRIDTAVAD